MKEVILAKSAGFCFGVKRAVDTVYEQAGKENVYAAVFFVCPRSCPRIIRSFIETHGIVSQNAANVHLRIPCIDIFHKKFIFLL